MTSNGQGNRLCSVIRGGLIGAYRLLINPPLEEIPFQGISPNRLALAPTTAR